MVKARQDSVKLSIAGQEWSGWTGATVSRSIGTLSGNFSLQMTKYDFASVASIFKLGAECEIKLGNNIVITGYVEEIQESYDAKSHTLSISGRDRLADLVDCSETVITTSLENSKLVDVVEKVLAPFGIDLVKPSADIAALDVGKVVPQQSETAFEFLSRLCSGPGVLIFTDNQNGLILTRQRHAGRMRGMIQDGVNGNVLSASFSISDNGRFHEYLMLERINKDDTSESFKRGNSIIDPEIRPARVKTIVPDKGDAPKATVQWERDIRIAKSRTLDVTVVGWRDANGNLWVPDALVQVDLKGVTAGGKC